MQFGLFGINIGPGSQPETLLKQQTPTPESRHCNPISEANEVAIFAFIEHVSETLM